MSYCRWSTDNFACDLYIYESVYDCWTVHVAGARYGGPIPPMPPYSLLQEGSSVADRAEWKRLNDARSEAIEGAGLVKIDLPHAGETFNLASPGLCADKVEELLALGYQCPDYVVPALREEQLELDQEAA